MKSPLIILIITSYILISSVNPTVGAIRETPIILPMPGTMVHLSPTFDPPILKGIKVHPDNPFRFDFILDQGSLPLGGRPTGSVAARATRAREGELQQESTKLIKYFLASLTIPEENLWVNLSPYEKDHIVEDNFGRTEMGRNLLAQDYLLKQITASLMYPDGGIGKKFWQRIYEQAAIKFGTTNIPVNTFNKVWIVPHKAVMYENAKEGTAYVVKSELKVMLEEDYLSLHKNTVGNGLKPFLANGNQIGAQVIREIVVPALEKEINEGKNFAELRQICSSFLLAHWYKNKISDIDKLDASTNGGILTQVYTNQNKINGLESKGIGVQSIYQQYLQAFKKGVYNYIKEETDSVTQKQSLRKYFSGGMRIQYEQIELSDNAQMIPDQSALKVECRLDFAMRSQYGYQERANAFDEETIEKVSKLWAQNLKKRSQKPFTIILAGTGSKEIIETTKMLLNADKTRRKVHKVKIIGYSSDKKQFESMKKELKDLSNGYEVDLRKVDILSQNGIQNIVYENPDIVICQNSLYLSHGLKGQDQKKKQEFINAIKNVLSDKGLFIMENPISDDADLSFMQPLKKINNVRSHSVYEKVKKQRKITGDRASLALKGGIDFNSSTLDMQIQADKGGIKFNLDPAMIKELRNIKGFTPKIINIQPINVRAFLGGLTQVPKKK